MLPPYLVMYPHSCSINTYNEEKGIISRRREYYFIIIVGTNHKFSMHRVGLTKCLTWYEPLISEIRPIERSWVGVRWLGKTELESWSRMALSSNSDTDASLIKYLAGERFDRYPPRDSKPHVYANSHFDTAKWGGKNKLAPKLGYWPSRVQSNGFQ